MNKSLKFLLPILFFLSGFVSLGLQVAWNRVLGQSIGTDHISATIIVSIYMLGLGLGGYLGSKICQRYKHSLQIAFGVEILIAVFCLFSVMIMRMGQTVSLAITNHFSFVSYTVADLTVYFCILIVPTLLMGISLPIFIHSYRKFEEAGYVVGLLYGINILGALLGAFVGGMYLLPELGITKSVLLLSILNFAWSTVGLIFTKTSKDEFKSLPTYSLVHDPIRLQYYILSFVIGFIALSYEIIYFRILVYFTTATSYVFPVILFCYLLHMTIGSLFAGFWIKSKKSLDALIRILSVGTIATTSFVFLVPILMRAFKLPDDFFWISQLASVKDLYEVLALGFFVLTPVSFISGFFPILIHKISSQENGLGAVVGRVYLTQTLGNFTGTLVTGLVLLPGMGMINTVYLFCFTILLIGIWLQKRIAVEVSFKRLFQTNLSIIVICIICMLPVNKSFFQEIRYRGEPPTRISEEMEGTAFIYEHPHGGARIHIGAEPATSYNGVDFFQGQPGHGGWATVIVDTLRKNKPPENVLIIGIGTGLLPLSLRALYPDIKITIVELLDVVIREMEDYGSPQLKQLLKTSNVIVTDGRRFLNKVDPNIKYDLIQVGVFHVVSSGAGNLFTKEIQEKLFSLLTPDGIVTFNAYINPMKASLDIFKQLVIVSPGYAKVADVYMGGSELDVNALTEQGVKVTEDHFRKLELNRPEIKAYNFKLPEGVYIIKDRDYIGKMVSGYLPQTDDLAVTEYFLNHTITLPYLRDPRYWPEDSVEYLTAKPK